MLTFFSVIHVLLCVFMIFVILLQPGKDAGMGSALGGGATQTAFGGRGAVTLLTKVTAVCAMAFFITSLGLSFVGLQSSVTDSATAEEVAKHSTPAPASDVPANAAGDVQKADPKDPPPGNAPAPDAPNANDAVPAEKPASP